MKKILLAILLIPLFGLSQTQIGSDIDVQGMLGASGHNLSLSSDGSILAIGAPLNNSNGNDAGLVEVYKNTPTGWVKTAHIEGENAEDKLGSSVSLSSDGSTLAIGAPFYDGISGDDSGYVLVYKYDASLDSWDKAGNNFEGKAAGDKLGHSVSLASDGSIIAIGSPENSANDYKHGLVQVFEQRPGGWTQLGRDIFGEASSDTSGWSVSLSGDGSIVAIGARSNRGDVNNSDLSKGHVRVYKYNTNASQADWTLLGRDIDGLGSFNHFGSSISLSSNGSVLAAGAPFLFSQGYATVHENIGNNWTQIGSVLEGAAPKDEFGSSVSLSGDGSILAIGGPYYDKGVDDDSGHVKIYKNTSGTWTTIGDIEGPTISAYFGTCVSLSQDGRIVAIGSSGKVRVFNLNGVLSTNDSVLEYSNVKLSPNPAIDHVTISLQKGALLKTIHVYNSLGQFIKSTEQEDINTSNWSSGLYYLEIISDKGKSTKKLIKAVKN